MFFSVLSTSTLRNAISHSVIRPLFKIKQLRHGLVFSCRYPRSTGDGLANQVSLYSFSTKIEHADIPTENGAIVPEQHPIFKSINYEEIAGNDKELLQQLNHVVDQIRQMAHHHYGELPTHVKLDQWHELLALRSFLGRLRYLRFLHLNEMKRNNDKARKEKRRKLREEMLKIKATETEDLDRVDYGLAKNSLFLRIYDSHIDKMYNFRAFQGMMFGQKLVIDCSYDDYMVAKEIGSCAKQLAFVVGQNRAKPCPLNLQLVNFNPESKLPKKLHRLMPTMYNETFPLTWTSKSYLDMYPKEKLVYLTPHCDEILDAVNHDDIYIIGAMVDKSILEPLSLTKAKRAGIRYAKLPLDNYLDWGIGGKSLTVDQCVNIVGDALNNGSWSDVLKTWVPRRKLMKSSEQLMSSTIRNSINSSYLKTTFKRNISLYDFIMAEKQGDKGKSASIKWPQ